MNSNSQERDNALNQQLQDLIEEIKQYSADDDSAAIRVKRRIALNRFVNAIGSSGRLSKQTQWSSLANFEDYYNEVQGVTIEVKNSHSKEYMQQQMLNNCLKNDNKMKNSSYQRRRNRKAVSPSLPLTG